MNKVELQAKVDALIDEINFLRTLYDAVRMLPTKKGQRESEMFPDLRLVYFGISRPQKTSGMSLEKRTLGRDSTG